MSDKVLDRRSQILEASINIFSKEGFHNARMEDIALSAGVGKGTIYEYFRSKKELFKEMMLYAANMYITEAENHMLRLKSPKDKLIEFMRFNIEFLKENSGIVKVVLSQPNEINGDLMNSFMRMREQVESKLSLIIGDGIAEGVFRRIKPNLAAAVLMAIISRTAAAAIYKCTSYNYDPYEMLDIFFNGLCAD